MGSKPIVNASGDGPELSSYEERFRKVAQEIAVLKDILQKNREEIAALLKRHNNFIEHLNSRMY